ncbi:MAG: Ig-like domain-containing protein, partial [Candidatus Azotimanducaceae bacterium WSBS_2022_MAG_OTU7]
MPKTTNSNLFALMLLLASFVMGMSNANAQVTVTLTAPAAVDNDDAFDVVIRTNVMADLQTGTTLEVDDNNVMVGDAIVNADGMGFTFRITPPGSNTADIVITVPAGIVVASDDADSSNAALTHTVFFDNTGPMVAITIPSMVSAAFPATVTVTDRLGGSVSLASGGDIGVHNGRAENLELVSTSTDEVNGVRIYVYTVLITPDSGLTPPNNRITVTAPARTFEDDLGNTSYNMESQNDDGAVSSTTTFVARPTVMLSHTLTNLNVAGSFTITATFSESVTGFVADDVLITPTVTTATATVTGISAPVTTANNGQAYTLTITPTGTTNGNITISIPADVAAGNNAAGDNNLASTGDVTVMYDYTPPTVRVTSNISSVNASDTIPFEITLLFSEPVTGLTTEDLNSGASNPVSNGTVTAVLGPFSAANGGETYTVTINPTAEGEVTINIPAGIVMDSANRLNTAATTNPTRVRYDATDPDVSSLMTTLTGDPLYANSNAPFTVTVTFSEYVTGFEIGDATIVNAQQVAPVPVGNALPIPPNNYYLSYTLRITPSGTEGNIEISIPMGAVTDIVGNPNTASADTDKVTVIYDGTRPTVRLTSNISFVKASDVPFMVTIEFNEPVTGLTMEDFNGVITNGTVTAVLGPVSAANNAETYTLTIMPIAEGSVAITVPEDVAMDAAMNLNRAASNPLTVTYDAT